MCHPRAGQHNHRGSHKSASSEFPCSLQWFSRAHQTRPSSINSGVLDKCVADYLAVRPSSSTSTTTLRRWAKPRGVRRRRLSLTGAKWPRTMRSASDASAASGTLPGAPPVVRPAPRPRRPPPSGDAGEVQLDLEILSFVGGSTLLGAPQEVARGFAGHRRGVRNFPLRAETAEETSTVRGILARRSGERHVVGRTGDSIAHRHPEIFAIPGDE